ncbi:MAG TPA: class I SAM-dependent methyltransferase [Longimicrobium sp.]|nr:class I SAM-dependent methyltransferase [Longimicrobium sp.]
MQTQEALVTAVDDPRAQADWAAVRDSGMGELMAGYNLVLALSMLDRTGMARVLLASERGVPAQLLDGLDPKIGSGLIDYLRIRGIVEVDGDGVLPTERGRRLLAEVPLALLGYFHESYSPVLRAGAELLQGKASYGTDVERDGEALGRHCEVLFRSFGASAVLKILDKMGARSLLDLGCGSGGMLVDACQRDPSLRAIGLDISPEVVKYGRRRIAELGLSDRIEMVVGDAFAPETWPETARDVDAILTVGTLHEHFRDGEDAVVELLDRYADLLSGDGQGLILAEPELHRDEKDADFYLIHTFTRQGYPRMRDDWFPVFERSRLRCVEVLSVPETGFRFAYYHLVRR